MESGGLRERKVPAYLIFGFLLRFGKGMSGLYGAGERLQSGGLLFVFFKDSPLHKRPHDSRGLPRLLYEETLLARG